MTNFHSKSPNSIKILGICFHIIGVISVIVFLLFSDGCRSSLIVRDYRYQIAGANEWIPVFAPSDSGEGVTISFLPVWEGDSLTKGDYRELMRNDFSFYRYPIDTVVIDNEVEEPQFDPREVVKATHRFYEIKNAETKIQLRKMNGKEILIFLPEGKYLMRFNAGSYYLEQWIKDVEVNAGSFSAINIVIKRRPVPEHYAY